MSPIRVTWRRTIGRARSQYSTAMATAAFMAASAALFAFGLESAEGGRLSLAAVWTASVSPVLPVLAAIFGMETWSDERRSGRFETLLSSPVRERSFVLGKFLGVWTMLLMSIGAFHLASMGYLAVCAPKLIEGMPTLGFLPGFLALALQGALWSAVSVAASAAFRSSAASACATAVLLSALPRGVWLALMSWAPQGRPAFGEMPIDAHALDMACGLVSSATVLTYLILTATSLFVAAKLVAGYRLVGRGAASVRVSTAAAVLLSLALGASASALAYRLDVTLDIPVGTPGGSGLSARTRGVLSEIRGDVVATAFLSRRDPQFRPLAHFLRAIEKTAEAQGGGGISVRYVDPRWDLGAAERLVRSGVKEGSVVFERGHRMESVSIADGWDERSCVSALLKLAMPPQRRSVYWTAGHGEASFSAYGPFGMSDIARDIARDGYRNHVLDLATEAQMPSDCALVVVAGARDDFSRVETGRLDAYLRQGGRVMVLLSSVEPSGLATMLSGWGMRPTAASFASARTLSGTDVIASELAAHPVSAPLQGSQIVLEKPVSFAPSAAAEGGSGADRIEFSELARACGACVAAVAERGVGAGADLNLRPSRIIAIGDAGFATNGQLASSANANRDFFLNCIAYLAGTDAMAGAGDGPGRLVSGMDRSARAKFLIGLAAAFPAALFLLMSAAVAARRRRK